jgi:hypothetical protein
MFKALTHLSRSFFSKRSSELVKNRPNQKKTKALKDGAEEVELDVEGKTP